jgi:PAS domain S-box-containing protein
MTRRRSIRRTLALLIVLASSLAMACVGVGILLYEVTSYRPRATTELRGQSAILAATLRPALDFSDVESATRYLKTYRAARPDIAIAAVYDRAGRLFASDGGGAGEMIPAFAVAPGLDFNGNELSLWQPVERHQQMLGSVYLLQHLPPPYARLPQYGIMAGAVFVALAIVAAVLLGGARRHFIGPLSALVEATGRIARDEDYSVRAPVANDDELGQLARSFNQMIEVVGRREAALRESEERMRRLASATFEGIAFAEAGRVIEVNQQAADMFGYAPAEMIGRPLLEFAAPQSHAVVEASIGGHVTGAYEATGLRKDGTSFEVEARVQEFPYRGRSVRVIALGDITERKKAAEALQRSESRLQQAQKMEAVGRLAGGVAHDFNNMLTVILGQIELVMADLDADDPRIAALGQVQRAAEHSADLTRQLLTFARRQTVIPKVLDLNATVSGMLKMLERLIGEDINLSWRPGDNLWRVKLDPTQVDQILANLCVNSRDAIGGVGEVTIETRNVTFDEAHCLDYPDHLPGDFVEMAVTDTGHGIADDVLDHIFEPFFTTKGVGEGTGLGLATVFGIVTQNDGFLTVSSKLGAGTVFRVYLPRASGRAVQAREPNASPRPGAAGETVLLVEDEPAILNLGRRMLESLGYTVLTAGTPGEAIRVAESSTRRIDLLITDVVMPEMNGRDLARRLSQIRPGLRCLFVSGYAADVIADRGVLEGGAGFLQKPFSVSALAVKIREVLQVPACSLSNRSGEDFLLNGTRVD